VAAAVPLTASAAVTGSESSLTATTVRRSPSVHARTQIAHTQRLDISYRQFGRGTDLLLVPGFGCTMDDWDPLFLDALAVNYRVTVFNHDGVGATRASGAQLSIHVLAEDTANVITALKLRTPDVLGWSMGGMISQDLVINHPGLAHRLVLAASIPGGPASAPPSAAAIAALQDTTSPVQNIWTQFFPADKQDEIARWNTRIHWRNDYHAMTVPESLPLRGALVGFLQGQVAPELGRITVPTLVADGIRDSVTPPANSLALAEAIPHAELVVYPDSGHAFIVQYPNAFAARVHRFLQGG
jgi:pimeloyl-ACP methyl ester carboxylesterase